MIRLIKSMRAGRLWSEMLPAGFPNLLGIGEDHPVSEPNIVTSHFDDVGPLPAWISSWVGRQVVEVGVMMSKDARGWWAGGRPSSRWESSS